MTVPREPTLGTFTSPDARTQQLDCIEAQLAQIRADVQRILELLERIAGKPAP